MDKNWQKIKTDFERIVNLVGLEKKHKRKKELEKKTLDSCFWQDNNEAKNISQELELINEEIKVYLLLEKKIKEAIDLEKLALEENNLGVLENLKNLKEQILIELKELEDETLFSGKYDNSNAILSIHAGTGGVDAQDWALMLERMYLRFAEKMNWSVKVIDRILATEAGIKSVLLKINGYRSYAWFKGEHGVHRLGRISPFDAESLRQTSFALVEVLPEIKDTKEIIIKEKDLKIDVFKSSGPGGQSVNTTDSAIRITHLPTKIVVSSQSERSQHQNKENALNVLKAKLYKLKEDRKDELISDIKGLNLKAEWGNQIRSYILYGNQIVKDHRSQVQKKDPQKVLDGDLKEFALGYLRLKSNL
jgi:peptide chain release factor 2